MHLDEISVAHDSGQDIVEVVGDPTGQNPQAFEFLGVEETAFHVQFFFLGPFSLGDVPQHDKSPLLPVVAIQDYRTDFGGKFSAILADIGQLAVDPSHPLSLFQEARQPWIVRINDSCTTYTNEFFS